jgi:hypothetical protein
MLLSRHAWYMLGIFWLLNSDSSCETFTDGLRILNCVVALC